MDRPKVRGSEWVPYAKRPQSEKDPQAVESGRRGALKRWHGTIAKVADLDGLTDDQRAFVLDMVRDLRAAAKS